MKFLKFCILILLMNSNIANAETIRWVTESWQNYTNEDGSGLYNDILRAVFAEYQLETVYIPWKRALLEVKNGSADITGATSAVNGYSSSHYPILSAPTSILYKKSDVNYTNLASLENYVGVWAGPYEDELFQGIDKSFFNGFSVQERDTAYKLLLSGRADYFLDTRALQQAWLASQELTSAGKFKAEDYVIVNVSRLNLYMIFTDNERGGKLKEIFDHGIDKLKQQGELRKIYEKYQFIEQMPPVFDSR